MVVKVELFTVLKHFPRHSIVEILVINNVSIYKIVLKTKLFKHVKNEFVLKYELVNIFVKKKKNNNHSKTVCCVQNFSNLDITQLYHARWSVQQFCIADKMQLILW